jgi:tetratricopeptide (TPR) repeat protein
VIEPKLTLKYTARPQRPIAAVLLPGGDARRWIQWLIDAQVTLQDVRLLPIQVSSDTPAVGVLCPVTSEQAARFSPRISRYGVVGGRLFIPIESTFDPPVADAEWDQLLPHDDSQFVWHPQHQLMRYEAEYQLHPAALLSAPAARAVDWNQARSGTAERPRLLSLRADSLPAVEQILSSGQSNIGLEADERFKSPPAESRPSGFDVSKLIAAGFRPLASLADWIRSKIPAREQGTDFYDQAVRWLNQMAEMMPKIERERDREIRRLLEKLEQDPDEGLKFALPMSGLPGRGTAAPGSRLAQRDVDFRLRPGGGGPVDAWTIDYELQQQLLERYRAAAEREVNLGRFRRAAYIHAELLGDYHSAANALEQGRHYHEAAAIYRDKLSRPVDAARCLERGGLLQDAIEIYTELDQMEKVGELYLRLQQPGAARDAFQAAVDFRLNEGNRLAAAELLQSQLDDGPAALAVLWDGWPDSGQATECLQKYFEALGERGDHSRAFLSIDAIRATELLLRSKADVITSLSNLAGDYPHIPVRDHAADATRLLASDYIHESTTAHHAVMQAIARLAPEDRLLERDCRRFKLPERTTPSTATQRPTGAGSRHAELTRQIAVPDGYYWLAAETIGQHVYMVGHDDDHTLVLFRIHWSADSEECGSLVIWSGSEIEGAARSVLLGLDRNPHSSIRIAHFDSHPLPTRMLPKTDQHPQAVIAETPGWLADNHIGLACSGQNNWTLDTDYVLTRHTADGVATSSIQLNFQGQSSDGPITLFTVPIPMHARSESVSVGLGTHLYRVVSEHRAPQVLRLPSRITGISGSRRHTRERLLVTHDTGACLLFPSGSDFGEIVIEEQMADLRGTVLGNGCAILWAPGTNGMAEFRQYSTTGRKAELLGTTAVPDMTDPSPVKLLRTDSLTECAVIPSQPGIPVRVWTYP